MRYGTRAVIVLATLLLLSAAANWFLYSHARLYYLQSSELRLDPLGLRMGDTSAIPPRGSESARVVFVGDSRAISWKPQPFPEDHLVINRGVGAQTTIQILERFDRQIPVLDPDLIILQAGVNDLKMIGYFPERTVSIIEDCRRNLRELVRRSLSTGAQVVLVTVFPRGPLPPERLPFWTDAVDSAIIALNNDLLAMTAERLSVLDASFLLDDEGYVRDDYAEDLLHLTTAGYDRLNMALAQILATGNRVAVAAN